MMQEAAMQDDRRKAVRRTAFVLALIALAFYVGFILLTYYRAH